MFKAIKNHIIDCLISSSGKWLTSYCFFVERVLINKINAGKRLSSQRVPFNTENIDDRLKELKKKEREKIKYVYTSSYADLNQKTMDELGRSNITLKSGVFKLVTEKGKNIYFQSRYLGFILYQMGVKEDYLTKHAFYYPYERLLLIYSRSNRYVLAGVMRLQFDYTDDLLYPEFENSTDYAGIDYGFKQSNIDTKTGLRFGVISQDTISQAWYDSSKPYYPCKECEYRRKKDKSFYCDNCEPSSWYYKDREYLIDSFMDNTDVIIVKSPYFTYAQFCSPCAPGACNLDSPLDRPEQDNKCYCLGHDWFENGKAPYPVFDIKTGQLENPK